MKIKSEIKIGILGVVSLAILILGYKFLKGQNIFERTNIYHIRYDYVDQLTESSPVFVNGFQVGSVIEVKLDPLDPDIVLVTINVDKAINVPKDTRAVLFSTSIMGNKSIMLDYKRPCIDNECAKNGDYLIPGYRGLIGSMLGANELEEYFDIVKTGVGGIMDTISGESADNPFANGLQDFGTILSNLKDVSQSLNRVVIGSEVYMSNSLQSLDAITQNMVINNDRITRTLVNLETITDQLSNANLGETLSETNLTVKDAREAVQSISATAQEAQASLATLHETLNKINNGEGSLGLLVNNRELYDNLQRTSQNMELLLQDIRLNPKRYINISVFGKKQKEYEMPEEDPAYDDE